MRLDGDCESSGDLGLDPPDCAAASSASTRSLLITLAVAIVCRPPAHTDVARHDPPPGAGGKCTGAGSPLHLPFTTRPSRPSEFLPNEYTRPDSSRRHECVPPSAASVGTNSWCD